MSGSGISWAICKSAPRSRQITTPTPHHSVFTGRMPFLPPNQQRQSTEGTSNIHMRQQQIVTHWQYATLAFSACQKRINSRIASRTVEQSAYQYTNIIDNQRRKKLSTHWLTSLLQFIIAKYDCISAVQDSDVQDTDSALPASSVFNCKHKQT